MAKSLLIVESPAKARTLNKYLGKDIEVKASVGHIRDLPVNRLGVEVDQDFSPEYITISGKQKVINELKKAAKGKDVIYLGPDPDREGEAIAWHIAQALKGKNRRFARVLFHELTPAAVKRAIESPEEVSETRFEAQQARRILDRLVGYRLSPLLWEKVKRGLSAGRVQSVALKIIAEREREIFAFNPEEYWSLTARLLADGTEFSARLHKQKGKKVHLKDEDQTKAVLAELNGLDFTVENVIAKQRKRNPLPPFNTSQLQQAAFSKLRLPTAKTMRLAQQLYEGMDVGPEGSVGLITYMRTDSVRVSNEALDEVRGVIKDKFGDQYLPDRANFYRNKKGAQDAHEAIRPTSAARTPEEAKKYLSGQLLSLYELIWRRFTASQMKPALMDQTTADIQAGPYTFRAAGSVLKFKGFLEVYDPGQKEEKEVLPPLSKDQILGLKELLPKQHFTQPPPRFTEATLVKELEENGIGRPSTYASIIQTIRGKDYVESNKGQIRPTELGFIVNDLLAANFPRIMDVEFTAGMEEELDQIEEGRAEWRDVLARFYKPFEQDVEKARQDMISLKRNGLKTELKCDQCGSDMVMKYGRNGPFLSCEKYPECKNAHDFSRDENGRLQPVKNEIEPTGETCEKCGQPMVSRRGKYGAFLACSGYPKCKNTKPLNGDGQPEDLSLPQGVDPVCEKCGSEMAVKRSRAGSLFIACTNYPKCKNAKPYPTGVKCPRKGCDGDLAQRSSKRGIFYGCSNYPKCRYILKNKPVAKECPQCGHPLLTEVLSKEEGQEETLLQCPVKDCDYQAPAEPKSEKKALPADPDLAEN